MYKVLNEECPEVITECSLTDLSGYRIACDISIFLYKYIRSAGTERWVDSFVRLLCTLKSSGATIVCIFDGDVQPDEKRLEQESRRSQLARSTHRLQESKRIYNLLTNENCRDDSPLSKTLREECQSLIYGSRKPKVDDVDYDDPHVVRGKLAVVIGKLTKQTVPITPKHRDIAEKLVKLLGLSCYVAKGEAEALCCYLACHDIVDGVLTEDTDVLAYRTPYMFSFKDFKLEENKIQVIRTSDILEKMELTGEEFTDLCILLSCDYNSRAVGYPPDGKKRKKAVSIGWKGAVAMIKEYRRLEIVSDYLVDDTPLRFRRCRELFSIPPLEKIPIINPYGQIANVEDIETFFKANNIRIGIEYVLDSWKPAEIYFEEEENNFEEEK